jgi:hypothetical protein
LFEGPELGNFGSGDFVEDDLEHGESVAEDGRWEKVDLPLR